MPERGQEEMATLREARITPWTRQTRRPRGPRPSISIVLALIVIGALGHAQAWSADRLTAPASEVSVIDGDTIQIRGSIVQLYGIDAPELGQRCYYDGVWARCGLNAAFELRKLIQSEHAPVHCRPVPRAEGNAAQVCLVGQVDVAHNLLESGYAVISGDTSEGYREAEASARRAGLGLWHSEFIPPAEWRAGVRLPDEPGPEKDPCPVKAVSSATGNRFYYVPTDDAYHTVEVDGSTGGRLFCSDEQARQAGWRREGEAPTGTTVR